MHLSACRLEKLPAGSEVVVTCSCNLQRFWFEASSRKIEKIGKQPAADVFDVSLPPVLDLPSARLLNDFAP